jgi:hypothetical protein
MVGMFANRGGLLWNIGLLRGVNKLLWKESFLMPSTYSVSAYILIFSPLIVLS